jgi:nucleotide-binding universal stress UspA family protein
MFKKILVPLDGSKLAEKILPQVQKLAKCHKAKVTLMTVGGYGVSEAVGEATPGVVEEASAHAKQEAEAYLKRMSAALKKKGVDVTWAYREGLAARKIIGYAEEKKMDLIALASHGRGEVAWVLGSVAEKVVSHATVPVLLLRVMEFKPPLLKEEFFMGA